MSYTDAGVFSTADDFKGLTHTRSFEGMTIDGALRHFLSGFWLLSETQSG